MTFSPGIGNYVELGLWTTVEPTVAIVCACLPCMRILFKKRRRRMSTARNSVQSRRDPLFNSSIPEIKPLNFNRGKKLPSPPQKQVLEPYKVAVCTAPSEAELLRNKPLPSNGVVITRDIEWAYHPTEF